MSTIPQAARDLIPQATKDRLLAFLSALTPEQFSSDATAIAMAKIAIEPLTWEEFTRYEADKQDRTKNKLLDLCSLVLVSRNPNTPPRMRLYALERAIVLFEPLALAYRDICQECGK